MGRLDEFQVTDEAIQRLRDRAAVGRTLSEGESLQKLLGFSDETMEKFYGAARRIFLQRRWEDAINAFTFLTTINPLRHVYWLGLAMSQQESKQYEDAVINYGMAILTQPENPVPHFYMAKCYFALEDQSSAEACLNLASEHAKEEGFLKAIEEAQRFLKNLKHK